MNENDVGLLVKRLADKIKASVDALLKDQGLTFSQTLVIRFLSHKATAVGIFFKYKGVKNGFN